MTDASENVGEKREMAMESGDDDNGGGVGL